MRLGQFLPRSTLLGSGKASPYTIVAGAFLAAMQVLNQVVVTPGTYRDAIAVLIGAAAAFGVQPLFGPALTNLVHIPAKTLFYVASLITAANGYVSVLSLSTTLHTVVAAVLTLAGALLFGSPILAPPTTPPSTA